MIRSLLYFLAFVAFSVSAEQTVIRNYEDARDNYFYDQLYVGDTGESLYCGVKRPFLDTIG